MKKNILLAVSFFAIALMIGNTYAQSLLRMNEIYSRGVTGNLDWIEVYNTSSSSIDISGYKIYDIGGQGGTKPKKEFPIGTVVAANGFFIITTDTADFTGDLSGFGLSSSGETVWLEDSTGTLVDEIAFPSLQSIESYSRVPNGQTWIITNSITKGTSNIYSSFISIVMNEIYSRGTTSDPDWIELYNPASSDVDISGYKIYDSGGQAGTKPKKVFPSGSLISANGFIVIVTDDTSSSGFGLSSGGEEVWLEDENGLIINDITFPAMDLTQSYSRYPDGTTNWQLSNFITKGFANSITDVENEIINVSEFKLNQNYPNPFNPTTTINFVIPTSNYVTLKVFNLLGKEVATLVNELKGAGSHSIDYNAAELSSGVYFYQLKSGNFIATKKFILMK